jgi:hypothetical protein
MVMVDLRSSGAGLLLVCAVVCPDGCDAAALLLQVVDLDNHGTLLVRLGTCCGQITSGAHSAV